MNLNLANIKQATRLTRAGRLTEAMALLRGGDQRKPDAGTPAAPALDAIETTGKTEPQAPQGFSADPSPRARLEAFRALRDRFATPASSPLCDMTAPLRKPAAFVPVPDGALFDERRFANTAGVLDYKLYVPGGARGRALPLVVMLHGCTQSADDFALGTGMNALAEEHGFLVAYPEQSAAANMQKCWNWFRADDQLRDQGEPSLIAGVTRQIMREFPVDPARVFIAGLSAGGAAAAIMGSQYPELYAAIGVHSGLAPGAASDMPSAFSAMRQGGVKGRREAAGSRATLPAIVFHGDADRTVNAVNGDQVIAAALAGASLRETSSSGKAPGGVSYTKTVRTDARGDAVSEYWVLHGAGHAWSGGNAAGSYTEPRGPDASREMARFFLQRA